jgi:MYXO-CTERM domain-containing protein
MTRLALLSCLAVVATAGTVLLSPSDAAACGGTFCDGGSPQPMPVDQSGENILFVIDDGYIEAHIQIQYEGDPEKFGWVIPLTQTPDDLAPGSEALFDNLLAGSVPQYGFNIQRDQCNFDNGQGLTGTGAAPDGGFGDEGGTGAGDDGGSEGPQILIQETVGSFEITVLTATTAEDVVTWLDENGYQQDEESVPILQQYLDENHVFAAVKLTDGAGLGEIHPIVLRFASDEPCVPLRLTRIAAVEDMEVRTFFLSRARVAPRNYRHVLVNPLKIDWPNQATNYKEAITLAVDAESADGRAFVTEYAGPSNVVLPTGVFDERWNAEAFRTIAPVDAMSEIMNQGFWSCGWDPNELIDVCGFQHPLVQQLMMQYLPPPTDVAPEVFYDCTSCYEDLIDLEAWNGDAFADALQTLVIEPGQKAAEALATHPYLTRMYTTISPAEMTEDPMFHQTTMLEDVTNLRQATQRILCNGDSIWTLPDGREVYLPAGAPWPSFDDVDAGIENEPAEMPMAERIAEIPAVGAPMELVNNTEVIDAKLAAYNAVMGWNGEQPAEGGGPNGASEGCGCTVDTRGAGALWMLAIGAGLGLRRRRRV